MATLNGSLMDRTQQSRAVTDAVKSSSLLESVVVEADCTIIHVMLTGRWSTCRVDQPHLLWPLLLLELLVLLPLLPLFRLLVFL